MIPSVRWGLLAVFLCGLASFARGAMMIDMRGFPDTEGNCRAEGFQRNDTDCTQFFRCVDFNRNSKYTIFRFMCGPMAVFDESRSLCTGPELSVPPCPADQLAQFFVMMKPDPPSPPAPAEVFPVPLPPVQPPSPPAPPPPVQPPSPPSPPSPPPPPPPVIIPAPPVVIFTETQTVVEPSPAPIEPSIPVIEETLILPTIALPEPPVLTETTIFSTAVITQTFSTVISTVVSTVVQTVVSTPVTSTIVVSGFVEKDVVGGFITIGDREVLEFSPDASTSAVPIPSDVPFGIVSHGDGSLIVIEEPGKATLTVNLPPGSILVANTTQSGGFVTNVSNGLITTSTSTASFPPGTTLWIAILGGNGEIVRWQQIVTTMTTTTIKLPSQTFIGLLTIIEQRIFTIGGWTYTIHYFTTTNGVQQAYVVLQAPPSTTNSQMIVTTTSTTVAGNLQTISGIITVGGLNNFPVETTTTSDLIVPGGSWLGVIPQGGSGVVTINDQGVPQSVQVQAGEILAILTPTQGVVTQVIQQSFTSQTSVIRIPGGSTVSVMKIGTDGRLITTVTYKFTNEITVVTTVYSTVGIIRLTQDGVVSSISQAKFTIQTITGSSFPIYFGILNFYTPDVQVTEVVQPTTVTVENQITITQTLEPSITTVQFTTTAFVTPTIAQAPQTVTITQSAVTLTQTVTQEVTTVTQTQVLPEVTTIVSQVTSEKDVAGFITIGDSPNLDQFTDISVPADSPLAVVSQGSGSTVTIQENGSPAQTFTVPAGAILMVNTVQNGGIVTDVASNTLTTPSTTATFPAGTTFWIVTVGSNGKITKWTTLVKTTTICRVTVPANSFVGIATVVNEQLFSIANWVLITQYVTVGTSTTLYGVLQNPGSTATTITTTSTGLNGDNQFISGIISITQTNQEQVLSDLTVQSGQLLVVIPSGGQGIVSVTEEGGARDDFDVTPGSMLGILAPSSGPGSVTQLNNQIFTTGSTVISFPAGSTVSVLRIGTDGRLIRVSSLEIKSAITVTTTVNSIVGIVGTSNDGVLTSVGSGRFVTQRVIGTFSVPLYFGVINFNAVSTTSFLAEALTGIVKVGDSSLVLNRDESVVRTVTINPGTTNVVVNSGDFLIIEEDGITTRKTTFTIPAGSALGIVTSNTGGEATGIINNFFTSSVSRLTFASGAQFGILIVRQDGTSRLLNTVTTTVKTTVTVPSGSLFGQLNLNENGVVSSIGSAAFSTQFILLKDSTGPEVPAVLGHVGVLHFREGFDFSRFVVLSTSQVTDLNTLAGLLFVNAAPEQSSVGSLDVRNGESLALIPAKGQGDVTVTEGGLSVTYTVLPGQIFGVMDIVNGRVSNLKNLVFTTEKSVVSFGAGSTFGIVKIGADGKMLTVTIMRTAASDVTVTLATGSAVGVVTSTTERRILSIGGADFVVKSFEGLEGSVGVINLAQVTPPPAIVTQPTRPPQPPIAGPFTLNCELDALSQFPLDCSRFYQCSGDEDKRSFFIFPCAPGLIFDEVNAQCKNPGEATCDDKSSINDLGIAEAGNVAGFFQIDCSGELFRYPLNCRNFYQCFKNEKGKETIYVYSCANGLVFDDASRSCLKPEETIPCGVSDNLFRSPSFVFQRNQRIEGSLVSRARSFVQRLRIEGSSSVQQSVKTAPVVAGRGASQSKMTIHMSKGEGRQAKIGETVTKTVTRTFQQRTFDSNTYGTRIAPRSRSGLIQ